MADRLVVARVTQSGMVIDGVGGGGSDGSGTLGSAKAELIESAARTAASQRRLELHPLT